MLSNRIHFLFPVDPLDRRRIDEHFAEQRAVLLDAGFFASLVPESAFEHCSAISGISPQAVVVYRGWMLDANQYQNLDSSIRASGGAPLTPPTEYLLAHHLPNWYPRLRELTPETVVYPENADLESELRKLGWSAFFMKDYVKSLKTSAGSLIADPCEAARVVDDMRRFRGAIEGGICVRRVERFRENSEVRYFVVRGRAFAPASLPIPDIVHEVVARIDHPFFSIDIAENDDGVDRVVEIGDGQVSDLVGWSAEEFSRMWLT